MSNVLIISASPRKDGVSARYAAMIGAEHRAAGNAVMPWSVADHEIHGCTGCAGCRGAATGYSCVIRDDMHALRVLLDEAAIVEIVCPVYFAGAPSQFKAVLDRLQPYWERRRGPNAQPGYADLPKRPVSLHVMGAGGDPFGFEALVTTVRSAFGAAGFDLHRVEDHIGWGQPDSERDKTIFTPRA